MRYLCLVYLEPQTLPALSPEEDTALLNDSLDYDDELRGSGHYIASDALKPVSEAVTVRVRNGRMSTTDGPFAETREHLGGFILVEARDLNEAVQVASKIPIAKYGSIEVRPVQELQRR